MKKGIIWDKFLVGLLSRKQGHDGVTSSGLGVNNLTVHSSQQKVHSLRQEMYCKIFVNVLKFGFLH